MKIFLISISKGGYFMIMKHLVTATQRRKIFTWIWGFLQ